MLDFIKKPLDFALCNGLHQVIVAVICLTCWGVGAQSKPDTGQLLNNLPQQGGRFTEPNRKKDSPQRQYPSSLAPTDPATDAMAEEAQLSFVVNGLQFEGNTVFDAQTLAAVATISWGSAFTLAELEEKMANITEHYRRAGYPLARAHLPAQVVEDGVVRVVVTEPQWGQVVLDNQSAIKDEVIVRTAHGIRPGVLIHSKDIESTSIFLTGLSGATLSSKLSPGATQGTTDLVIQAQPGPSMSSSLTTDNFGSRYTGKERTGAYFSWNNPLRSADVFSLNLLSSGSLLNYQQIGYELPVLLPGASTGASVTHMQYQLGNGAEALMAHGHLKQFSPWVQYVFLASDDAKSDVRVQYEASEFNDQQDNIGSNNNRHMSKWSVSLNLEQSDDGGNAGLTQFNASVSMGRLFFNDAIALANDAATAQTAGEFAKVNLRANRNQALDRTWSLVLSLDSQLANRNLDSTQKFAVGGFHSVRAYDAGALSADEAVFISVECRALLPPPPPNLNISGAWYGAVFWDAAKARINKRPWSNSSNEASLSSTGVGVYWQGLDHWRASLAWANAQGALPEVLAASGVSQHSVWLELSKGW